MNFRRVAAALTLPFLLVAGCSSDDDPDTPSATVKSTTTTERSTTTTEALTPEQEVEAAYLKSWDVYAKALRELDPEVLSEAYAGAALESRRQQVSGLKAANTPGIVSVEHNYVIDVIGPDRAVVTDRYLNKSVLIDPVSREPIEPVPNKFVRNRYDLRREGEQWRVVSVGSAE